MSVSVIEAILNLVPEAQVVVRGEYPDYEIDWINPAIAPVTDAEINAEYQALLDQEPVNECKAQAMSLLQATDWVNQPDVRDPANSPHLVNFAEFDVYRLAVRQYAVYPVANPMWPTKPTEQWSS